MALRFLARLEVQWIAFQVWTQRSVDCSLSADSHRGLRKALETGVLIKSLAKVVQAADCPLGGRLSINEIKKGQRGAPRTRVILHSSRPWMDFLVLVPTLLIQVWDKLLHPICVTQWTTSNPPTLPRYLVPQTQYLSLPLLTHEPSLILTCLLSVYRH